MRPSKDVGMLDKGPYLHWFYRNMKLFPPLDQYFLECYPSMMEYNYTAIHLRVEKDWELYCQKRDLRPDPSKSCLTPGEIADAFSLIHQTHSEEAIVLLFGPLSEKLDLGTGNHPLEVFRRKFPLAARIVHKDNSADSCMRLMKTLTYNAKALLDAWAAIHAKVFVGTLSSTFSNGMTQARTLRGRDANFIYSCPRIAPMVKRRDGGDRDGLTDGAACRHAAGEIVLTGDKVAKR